MRSRAFVNRVGGAHLPLPQGDFRVYGYRDRAEGREHLAAVMGEVRDRPGVLVRVHSECLTGDVFGSRRCDCGEQLQLALERIAEAGSGVVVYVRGHEGRGIGLLAKVRAYELQDAGVDTVEANLRLGLPADSRDYGVAAEILRDLGVREVSLLTNNPAKQASLEHQGLSVVDRVPLQTIPNGDNSRYLRTKQDKLGHLLGIQRRSIDVGPLRLQGLR
jgi:3,4-dihydroxy 2-butanone 4-phosphate synthase/GTP cyclohydrolase II